MKKFIRNTAVALITATVAIAAIIVIKTLNHTPPPFSDVAEVNIQLDEAK